MTFKLSTWRPSLGSLLSTSAAPLHGSSFPLTDLKDIQEAMLALVPDRQTQLRAQVTHAATVEALWFLRANLLEAIALAKGEQQAWKDLAAITKMFGK